MSDDGWEDVDTSEYENMAPIDSGSDDGWEDVTFSEPTRNSEARIIDDEESSAPSGPGWWDSTIAAVQRGLDDFNASTGEVSQTLGRFAKDNINDSVGNDLEGFGSFLKRGAESWRPSTDAVLTRIPENSWQKTGANVTQGLSNAFPSLLTGGANLLRTVGLNAITRFGQTEGDIEKELRKKGINDEQAIIEQKESGAGVSTALNAPLDAVFMAPIFNQGTKPIRKTIESTIGGAMQALPAKWADLYGRYQGGAAEEAPGLDEVMEGGGNNILEGAIQGGTMGAAMAGVQATGDYFSNKTARNKTLDWEAKLTENVKQNQQQQAEMDALIAAEKGASTDPNARDFTLEETGRADGEFDQKTAQQFAENQALTKMGVTEKLPESPEMKVKTTTKAEQSPLVEDAGSSRVSTSIPDEKAPMKPVDEGALDKFPVVEYDLSKIEDLPEVPNMKRKATGKGGVVPGKELKSNEYQRLPKNPITLLEMNDGRIGVVTGRHRRRLANDLGEKTIPAQVVRERDGYTVEWARMFDAEQNIRDGQGEVDDYANYFRQAKLSPEEADKRGLLRNSTGKDGYEIGNNGSQDVYDRYMNNDLTTEQAAAIARAAPKDDEGQTAGVALVKGGTTLKQLKSAIDHVKELQAAGVIPKESGPEQGRLPGMEDTATVMKVVIAQANAAEAIIKDIEADIYSNRGAAKNPDKAAKGGTLVKDQEATRQYIKEREALKARWKDWRNDPELKAQLTKQFTTAKRGYEEIQKVIDERESGLPENLLDSDRELKKLYEERDAVGQRELVQSYHEILPGIKSVVESPEIAAQILERVFSVNPKSETGQYMAAKYTQRALQDKKTIREIIPYVTEDIIAKKYPNQNIDIDSLLNPNISGLPPKAIEALKSEIASKSEAVFNNVKDYFNPKTTSDPVIAAEKMDVIPDQQTGLFQIDNSADVFPAPIKKPFTETNDAGITNLKESDKSVTSSPLNESALTSKIRTRLSSEKGAVNLDIPNPFTSDGFKDFTARMKGKGIEKNPEIYNFFNSKRNLLASEISKADKFPQYRRSHEAALKMFEMENSIAWDHDQMLRPFTLLNAKEKQNVSTLLYAGLRKGPNFDSSPGNLKKLGLSDREVRGVQSVRKTMDSALESMRQLAKEKVGRSTLSEENKLTKMQEIDQSFDGMKASNFVPTGRYGKYGLTLYDQAGKVVSFTMNDSKAKLANALYEAIRKDPTIDPKLSRVAPVAKALGSEYVGAHPDIMDIMQDGSAHIPNASFENRFKKRELIEGFEADLQRNISSYLSSHARYLSSQKTKQKFADLNKQFDSFYETLGSRDKSLYSGLRQNINQLQDFVMKPTNTSSAVSKVFANFYLANAFKTSLVNTTSFFTSSYPKVAKYTQGLKNLTLTPERIFARSIADTAIYYGAKSPEISRFTEKYSGVNESRSAKPSDNLWAGLEAARKEGVVGGNRVMKDLLTNANRPTQVGRIGSVGQKISVGDLAFFLNGTTEDFVRTNAYITGWHTYPHAADFFKKQSARNAAENQMGSRKVKINGEIKDQLIFDPNIKLPDRHTFAKDFVRETQADYTKAGIPDIAKNPVGKLGSTFRLYHHAFLTSLKRSVMEHQWGAATRYAAAMGTLGGAYAVPILGSVALALKAAGLEVDEKAKQGLEYFGMTSPRTQQMVMNGIPTHPSVNLNLRGAMSPEIVPQELAKGDVIAGLGKAFAGVLADPVDRVGRAWYYYNEKGDTPRAIEQLLPPAFNIQHLVTAARWKKEGVRNSSGVDILGRPPTDSEILRKQLGFTPATISAAMDRDMALGRIKSKLDNENINQKIAKAEFAGDSDMVTELESYADEKGLKIDPKSIMDQLRKMEDRNYAIKSRVGGKAGMEFVPEIEEQFNELVNPE